MAVHTLKFSRQRRRATREQFHESRSTTPPSQITKEKEGVADMESSSDRTLDMDTANSEGCEDPPVTPVSSACCRLMLSHDQLITSCH